MKTDRTVSPKEKKRLPIDWQQVKQRLETVRAALELVSSPGPEETRRILTARAQTLGQRCEAPQAPVERIEVVEFALAQERYAIESRFVRDIYPLEHLTPLPCTPTFVLGIVNLRGEILSVIDIKKFFDLPGKGLTDLDKVMVLECGGMRFGILADAIAGTRRIAVSDIQLSLPTITDGRKKYSRGVTAERTVILDAEGLLNDQDIVVQEQIYE